MKITPDIIRQEFIGTEAKIVKNPNPASVGLSGKVVDETKNTFTLMCENRKKIAIKHLSTFHFTFPDGTIVEIDGALLVGKPEDRLKKVIRRLW
ncbi:MAG: ribonuclease P protein component 1 [Candidatus Bathyarchaeia archaeon]